MQKESVVSYYPGIYLEVLTKHTKSSVTTAGIRAPDLNPEPPKHDTGGLCTRLVDCCLTTMILSVSTRSLRWLASAGFGCERVFIYGLVFLIWPSDAWMRPTRFPHVNDKLPTTAGVKRFKCSSFVSCGNQSIFILITCVLQSFLFISLFAHHFFPFFPPFFPTQSFASFFLLKSYVCFDPEVGGINLVRSADDLLPDCKASNSEGQYFWYVPLREPQVQPSS